MKEKLFLLLFFILPLFSIGQDANADTSNVIDTSKIYDFVAIEQRPEFPGGESELMRYLAKNTVYPDSAKHNGVAGTVYLSFVISSTGKVIKVELARGVTGKYGEYLNAEALRVVRSMPDWKPGKKNGKEVYVRYAIPIKFVLK